MPVAKRGSFVQVGTQMRLEFYACQILRELKIRRRSENRIAAENNQRFNFISFQRLDQSAQRFDLIDRICLRAFGERDRVADVAEKRIHQMRERMNRRRLICANNNNAGAAVLQQVFGNGRNPAIDIVEFSIWSLRI